MENQNPQNKGLVLFVLIAILTVVVWVNLSDPLKTNAQKQVSEETKVSEEISDPTKDFKSLNDHLAFESPEGWTVNGQVDKELGEKTHISLNSPDFEASSSGEVLSGIKIWISRDYDLKSEETLTAKLNLSYPTYDYNIRALKIGDKNAMSIHEDYQGHNRFIYIAGKEHLWTITISSKSLEDEQKYEAEVVNFLSSIRFTV